ncbi:hypothetical protein ACVMIH_001792 [Bradyrhizobium sp. USDA 4503]
MLERDNQTLERERDSARAAAPPDARAITAAEQKGFKAGFEEAQNQGAIAFNTLKENTRRTIRNFAASIDASLDSETIEFILAENDVLPTAPATAVPARTPTPLVSSRPSASGDGSLPGPQQRILNSLATWAKLSTATPRNAQVAWLAGYSPSSSSYANPRSALKTAGLIDYPQPDFLTITPAGLAKANPFKLTGSLLDFVLSNLPGPEGRILASIAAHYPKAIPNAAAAEGAQYSATSSSYANPRSALRTKDLITYPEKDRVRAADWLFAA